MYLKHSVSHFHSKSLNFNDNNLFDDVNDKKWPRKLRAFWQAFPPKTDILLGGLHMVHERHEERVCGKIMAQGGLQAMEVMLYTMDIASEG